MTNSELCSIIDKLNKNSFKEVEMGVLVQEKPIDASNIKEVIISKDNENDPDMIAMVFISNLSISKEEKLMLAYNYGAEKNTGRQFQKVE